MHAWLTDLLGRLSGRSTLAQAIRYALNHWKGLVRFLDDGRLELDTNIVERAMRPVALGRSRSLSVARTPFFPEPTLARHTTHLAMSLYYKGILQRIFRIWAA